MTPNQAPGSTKPAEREEMIRVLNMLSGRLDESPLWEWADELRQAAALLAADGKAGGEVAMTAAQQRMLHDFPALQRFHTKHALGPMLPPSCLCCGQQTHPITRPAAVKHLELPGIVICKQCKDASL